MILSDTMYLHKALYILSWRQYKLKNCKVYVLPVNFNTCDLNQLN